MNINNKITQLQQSKIKHELKKQRNGSGYFVLVVIAGVIPTNFPPFFIFL
jgi:hypothetical protein